MSVPEVFLSSSELNPVELNVLALVRCNEKWILTLYTRKSREKKKTSPDWSCLNTLLLRNLKMILGTLAFFLVKCTMIVLRLHGVHFSVHFRMIVPRTRTLTTPGTGSC